METADRTRWVGVGTSDHPDARRAGTEAARAALVGSDARVLLAFASDDLDLDAFAAGLVDVAGEVPVVGCSTAGEIGPGGISDGAAVVVAFGGPGFHARTALARDASGDLRRAGADVTTAAHPADGAHRAVILFSDGLAGDQQEVVRGAYSVAGALIPLVGGCAGDEMRMRRTRQIYGTEVLTDSVIAVGLTSDAPIGVAAQHGWRRVGEAMLVTASDAHQVRELDGRPALDVYVERLGVPATLAEDSTDVRPVRPHPPARARPSRRGGGPLHRRRRLRRPVTALHRRGAHRRPGAPDGGRRRVRARRDRRRVRPTRSTALGGDDPLGFARLRLRRPARRAGGDGVDREMDSIRSAGRRGAPVAGFYTYGEIARNVGIRGFHNQTLVVLALA